MPKLTIQSNDKNIDIEFAKIGIKDYFDSGKQKSVRFFSPGEPTLAFDQMVELTEYAKSITTEKIIFEIETNGFFNKDIASWLEKNMDIVWISCDGEAIVQDMQRPTNFGGKSSDLVLSNIKRFSHISNLQFGVRATISDENLNRQVQLIEFFNELGVKYVSAAPMFRSKSNTNITKTPILEFAHGFVPAFYKAKELGMFYLNLFIVNFDEQVEIYCQSSTPTPRLTPDGYVSCCDWAAFGSKYIPNGILNDLIIGEYNKEKKSIIYYKDRIAKLQLRNTNFLSKGACKNCEVLKNCAGGCVGKVATITNDLFTMDTDWCSAVKFLFEHIKVDTRFPVLNP
jgi:radical SAM protein with 4Fe4S-binding SPASM domain